jgi:hypothetical protein
MTDQTADIEFRDYHDVPRVYIALAWLWVAIPFATACSNSGHGQTAVLTTF